MAEGMNSRALRNLHAGTIFHSLHDEYDSFWRPGRDSNPRHARTGECSSVVRVTAVHTLGRLPQAVDRAILPLRIRRDGARARRLAWAEGAGVDAKIKLSSELIRRSAGRFTLPLTPWFQQA